MAVVHVIDGTDPREGSENSESEHKYTRVLTVIVDDPHDDAIIVRQGTGVPRKKDPYVTKNAVDLGALCVNITPRQEQDAPLVWRVTCEYDSKHGEQQSPGQGNENPLDDQAEIEWSSEKFKSIKTSWLQDVPCAPPPGMILKWTPIRNSAFEAYLDPPEIDDSRVVLKISRNQPTYNATLSIPYANALNSDVFFGAPPCTAKMEPWQAVSKWKGNLFYWRVTYEIHFKFDGWDLVILDAGKNMRTQVGSQGQNTLRWVRDAIRGKDGTPISDPVPLNGFGQPLALPEDGTEPVYVWNRGRAYRSLPFAPLNLP